MGRTVELDELVEHGTLLGDERELVAGKRGATRLGFALLLKFYGQHAGTSPGRAAPTELVGPVPDDRRHGGTQSGNSSLRRL